LGTLPPGANLRALRTYRPGAEDILGGGGGEEERHSTDTCSSSTSCSDAMRVRAACAAPLSLEYF
jgi:hypothetical protein